MDGWMKEATEEKLTSIIPIVHLSAFLVGGSSRVHCPEKFRNVCFFPFFLTFFSSNNGQPRHGKKGLPKCDVMMDQAYSAKGG